MDNSNDTNNKSYRRATIAVISLTASLALLFVVFIVLVIMQSILGSEAIATPLWIAFSALIAIMTGIGAIATWFVIRSERERNRSLAAGKQRANQTRSPL